MSKLERFQDWVMIHKWPNKCVDKKEHLDKLVEEANEVKEAALNWIDEEELRLELGDVLNLTVSVAKLYDISLDSIIDANVEKLSNRAKYGKKKYGRRS